LLQSDRRGVRSRRRPPPQIAIGSSP